MFQVPVRMPKMSMTMTEGEVLQWSAQQGDEISAGDVVCEVMTDKIDMEVEAPVSGTLLRIEVQEGVVAVGTAIGWISSDEADPLAGLFDDDLLPPSDEEPASDVGAQPEPRSDARPAPDAGAQSQPRSDVRPAPDAGPQAEPPSAANRPGGHGAQAQLDVPPGSRTPDEPVAAVPRARAMAAEHRIDLRMVTGTGPEGRVLVDDIERLIARPSSAAASSQSMTTTHPAVTETLAAPSTPTASSRKVQGVRAIVARTMTASAVVPQFTVWRDLDLGPVDNSRRGISWTTLLLRSYALALRQQPILMGRWDGTQTTAVEQLALGLAVDTPHGLLVPAFSDPDRVPVEALDAQIRATTAAARTGKVEAAHLMSAVATMSNLGGLGVERFQALVTPPQATVLAVGSITHRPVAVPGGVGLGLRVTVGLTVDHRVADGADGARALDALAASFAEPLKLLGPVNRA